jgi:hypothetical protein
MAVPKGEKASEVRSVGVIWIVKAGRVGGGIVLVSFSFKGAIEGMTKEGLGFFLFCLS